VSGGSGSPNIFLLPNKALEGIAHKTTDGWQEGERRVKDIIGMWRKKSFHLGDAKYLQVKNRRRKKGQIPICQALYCNPFKQVFRAPYLFFFIHIYLAAFTCECGKQMGETCSPNTWNCVLEGRFSCSESFLFRQIKYGIT